MRTDSVKGNRVPVGLGEGEFVVKLKVKSVVSAHL